MANVGSFLVHVNLNGNLLYESSFIRYLKEEGYQISPTHNWSGANMDWVWANVNDMEYHMPRAGIEIVPTIGNHALTEEEFYVIHSIYKRYDGLRPLEFEN